MSLLVRRLSAGFDYTGVAPAVPFSPDDITNLELWFAADEITGLADTDPVSTWADLSGNGRDLTGTTTTRPLYRTNIQNGLPAVRFDGTDDYMVTSSFGPFAQPNTIFVVTKWGGTRSYVVDGTGTSRHAIAYELNSGSGKAGRYAGSINEGPIGRTAVADLWSTYENGASSQFRWRAEIIDGATAGTQSLGALTVGAGNGGAFGFLNGDIHEVLVYSRALTEAERWDVEQHLSDKWHVKAPRRPDSPQTTPTSDASGEAMHPSVIDFQLMHGVASWNGYRYWMAMTPYPNGDDTEENPEILASTDGAAWEVPSGLTNPIDAWPGSGLHNADTCLAYDGSSTLYCFYLDTASPGYRVLARSSTDGTTWGSETEVLTSATETLLCPYVVKSGSTWHMWTVDTTTSPNTVTHRTSSSPTSGWSSATAGTLSSVPGGYELWHLSVLLDPDDGTWHAFMCLTSGGSSGPFDLALGRSSDGEEWNVSEIVLPNGTGANRWDSIFLYQTCGVILDDDTYGVWYSAKVGAATGATGTWRTGYGELSRWEAPSLPA